MESSIGKASAVPSPLRNVRRGRCLRMTIIARPVSFSSLKWRALHNPQHQAGDPVSILGYLPRNRVDGRFVGRLNAAPQSINQHLPGEADSECITVGHEDLFQLLGTREASAIRQRPGSVDGELPILCPPAANGVEVLQTEADRVHARMA